MASYAHEARGGYMPPSPTGYDGGGPLPPQVLGARPSISGDARAGFTNSRGSMRASTRGSSKPSSRGGAGFPKGKEDFSTYQVLGTLLLGFVIISWHGV
jgi:hypothetical protein